MNQLLINSHQNRSIEIIAFHGWGFDRRCWQFWQEKFRQSDYDFQAFDRGYFGNSHQPEFVSSLSKKIILVHSFGLHLCPSDLLQQADLLIAFNSFLSFHPQPKAEKKSKAERRSQLVLQQMMRQFEQTPEIVLQNFYSQAAYPQSHCSFQTINYQLLLQDLHQLNEAKLDAVYLESIPKILVFHSSDDRIVAAPQTQEFLTQLPRSCELISMLHAGHTLPFTHAAECWSMVQSALDFPVIS